MPDEARDYLLGTHDEEVERLGLQHRVWRSRVLDAWRRAGITQESTVVDAGAGPGWAAFDLAEIVGPSGRVHALERSDRFFAHLTQTARQRGLQAIAPACLDLVTDPLPVTGADAFWIRWVLAFVSDPALVLSKLAATLRPGGTAVIHEYWDWGVYRLAPHAPMHREWVEFVLADWRSSGGEPDIGRDLTTLLPAAGLRVREVRPLNEIVGPADAMWGWPAGFLRIYLDRLVSEGKRPREWADRVRAELDAAERRPETLMSTPMIMEVIAEKV